jgi:hypothetical protein
MSRTRIPASIQGITWSLAALALFVPAAGVAWIYSEHRDIAGAGIARLSSGEKESLDRLWAAARKTMPARLCEQLSAGDQGTAPPCIDFAAWAAISGDHSCSPSDLAGSVVPGPWILGVAAVAAETSVALRKTGKRQDRLNRIATMNLALQRADSAYATRAGANNAHFLLPREGGDAAGYLRAVVRQGAPLNALGLYAQYHLAALAAASRLPPELPPAEALDVLALEGYALHWLEDSFAAGHVVGTWGSAPWRKGTHDYYSEFGVDTITWNGEPLVAFGDANLRAADVERTSAAVAGSLGDLARALGPGNPLAASAREFGPGPTKMLAFNACKEARQPSDRGVEHVQQAMARQLGATPVPGRGEGHVNLPRFRDELGPFVGGFASIDGGVGWGGLSTAGARGTGAVSVGIRVGFGAEGVTGSIGTGLGFLEGGVLMAAAQTDKCAGTACDALGASNLFPRVPARTGLRLGLRLPFWLIPGDTLLLAPILALTSPDSLSKVGVAAASGGFIPYERSFNTSAGVFQVVLGREVQATLFGYLGEKTIPLVIAPIGQGPSGPQYGVVALKSLALSFPGVEWTPFRTFATQVAFSFQLQLGFGVELPLSVTVPYPAGATPPSVPLAWNIFLRVGSDGRYFVGSREDLQSPR